MSKHLEIWFESKLSETEEEIMKSLIDSFRQTDLFDGKIRITETSLTDY